MMHPAAIKTIHDVIDWMKETQKVDEYPDWTTLSIPEGV
jgi:hypothetical protein